MQAISCQVVIWAGEMLQYQFLEALFHFSLLDSALHLFPSFYKWAKPEENEDVLQNILKSRPVVGKMEGTQYFQLTLPASVRPEQCFPSFSTASEFHPGGHSFPLSPQVMSLRVATLMLFRQFSFSTQTVNWSRLDRLLPDRSAFPQI